MTTNEDDREEMKFNDHFLAKRLSRVPINILEKFVQNWKDTKDIKTQKKLINEIIFQLNIMTNNQEFVLLFKTFFQYYVLSARESEYLLQIDDKFEVIKWLKSLKSGKFIGQKYDFIFHNFIKFEEKYLETLEDEDNVTPISFPTDLVLLIAVSHNPIIVSNGLEPLYYHRTSEFEILFRKDMNLIEVRGDFQVIRDFVNTATLNRENPLSKAQSIFVGDRNETRPNTSLLKPAKFINIEVLRTAINGSYLSLSSAVSGVKTSRITMEFEGLNHFSEETDTVLSAIVEKTIKDPDKTRISFIYDKKSYPFGITKSGGLTFLKYTSENVITYILKKLRDISRS